jgi:hypothetical protein
LQERGASQASVFEGYADPQDGRAGERKESSMKQLTSEQFLKDVVTHALTVKLDSGLYRHLSFREPHSWNMWFDLVTWPGNLTISGDMGTWIFSSIDDMFKFFGSDLERVNPEYWTEKIKSESRFGGPSRKFVPGGYRDGEYYTYHYLWCLHAIVWGIQQYNTAKSTTQRRRRPQH